MGHSQREMLVILDSALQSQFGVSINECGSLDGVHIYLDDGIFSGGHVIKDLSKWISSDAPQNADLRVVTVAQYLSGCWQAEKELVKVIKASGKEVDLSFWCSLPLEDRLFKKNHADVFWPRAIPASAQGYFDSFTRPLELRTAAESSKNEVFIDDNVRSLSEDAFIEKGLWIRQQCSGLNDYQRPLGNSVWEKPGFGATFVTFRNCANNAPLVFWAGDPWYPLFPRKTNTDTALINAFDNLWE